MRMILQTWRRAMAPGSKLLLIERPLSAGDERGSEVVLGEVNMMVLTGGRERAEAEYQALLEAADLNLVRTVPLASSFSVIEAEPAARDHRG